jgi:hypothetical protein
VPNFSKLVDKVKQLAGKHPDQVNKGVDKAGDVVGQKTGGKYDSQIQEGADRAKDYLGTQDPGTPGQGTGNQ